MDNSLTVAQRATQKNGSLDQTSESIEITQKSKATTPRSKATMKDDRFLVITFGLPRILQCDLTKIQDER